MKKLLINGCSHTEASECDKGLADFLSEKLDVTVTNIAKGGGGNHRILRTTMEYCESNPVDLVIIGWSTHERFEFAWKGERKDYTLYKQSEQEDLQKFYRYLDLNVADWNVGLEDTITYQYALQLYLEANNIDYLYSNMFNSIPHDCQIPLWNSIDTSKYYKPQDSFIEQYMALYPNGFSETKHITDEKLYEKMAEELIEMYRWRYYT
ncbi:hypothetical protein N9J02_00275 [bacterium]|jgi:hypothetical protein|nr:hypothetical protein [bacterium]